MAEFAVAAMLVGTGMSAYGQYQQGKEQRALYKQRAAVAEKEAKAVTKAAEHQEREKRKEGKRYIARQKVLFAKSGVMPKKGTPSLVMTETAKEFARDAAFIQEGGAVEVARLRSQAEIERGMGKSAYRAGLWGAGATAMTGLGTVGMFGYEQGWFNKGTSRSSAGRGTQAWSGYRRRRRRTTFRGL